MYRVTRWSSWRRRVPFIEVVGCCCMASCSPSPSWLSVDRTIRTHTMLNETILRLFNGFHHDAHPMAMVAGGWRPCRPHHDTTDILNPRHRDIFAVTASSRSCRPYRGRTIALARQPFTLPAQ